MPAEDVKLLAGLRSGHRNATAEIVRRLEPVISRVVFRLTGRHSDTEDLVQEVFLALQDSSERFKGNASLETWAISIAMNFCRTHIRERQRARSRYEKFEDAQHIEGASESNRIDAHDSIWHGLSKLKHADRELIVLRYMEEMSLDQMSDLLEQRKNTLEVKIHRAKRRLAELLSKTEAPAQAEELP